MKTDSFEPGIYHSFKLLHLERYQISTLNSKGKNKANEGNKREKDQAQKRSESKDATENTSVVKCFELFETFRFS